MRNRSRISVAVSFALILLVCLFALWGCPMSAQITDTPEAQPEASVAPEQSEAAKAEAMAQDNAEKERAAAAAAAEASAREEEAAEARERASAASGAGLKPIYFDFDQSFVREDARPVMKANAEWLKTNPKEKVRIEGNCDARGTIEYNQALGQRRAAAAKKYLTDLGIASSRISLISYGKEKPVCNEDTEECWQQNRRGELVAATP